MAAWNEISIGEDGVARCGWADSAPDYRQYHDEEWGFPVDDDFLLFEKLCLEGFQSGLSWLTILRRREGFRTVFHGFDFHRVAEMTDSDVERLLGDERIIRHRGKIEATINNAARAQEVEAELGSLGAFFWSYEPEPRGNDDIQPTTPESTAMAKALKARGFRFVGPTTAYAFMQAMGIVNDHLAGCSGREAVERRARPLSDRGDRPSPIRLLQSGPWPRTFSVAISTTVRSIPSPVGFVTGPAGPTPATAASTWFAWWRPPSSSSSPGVWGTT